MRDAERCGDVARVVDVLAGAAGALAMGRRAMIVELQRDADDVVAFGLEQRSRRRGIDAARHGNDDPGVLRTAFEIQTVQQGLKACVTAAFAIRDWQSLPAGQSRSPGTLVPPGTTARSKAAESSSLI